MSSEGAMTLDELEAHVERILRVLPDDLADEWIDTFEDRGVDIGEDKTVLTLAFWDAVRIALRAQIVRGHREPIDDERTLERIEAQVLVQRIDPDDFDDPDATAMTANEDRR